MIALETMKSETLAQTGGWMVFVGGRCSRAFPASDSRASLHRWWDDIAVDGISVGGRLSRIRQAQIASPQEGESCSTPV
jgi:hypothetical protein